MGESSWAGYKSPYNSDTYRSNVGSGVQTVSQTGDEDNGMKFIKFNYNNAYIRTASSGDVDYSSVSFEARMLKYYSDTKYNSTITVTAYASDGTTELLSEDVVTLYTSNGTVNPNTGDLKRQAFSVPLPLVPSTSRSVLPVMQVLPTRPLT